MRHPFPLSILALALFGVSLSPSAEAKIAIVTTTTDLRALAAEVGGDLVEVDSIAKGTQDPHFIEAKPSYMTKAAHADLIISMGLDLEIGWLPSIVRGARNPKVNPGSTGFLELGPLVDPLEVPTGKITRAEGDVHPFGNPHFNLDPIRMGQAAVKIAEKLGELDTAHRDQYLSRGKALLARMQKKTAEWQARIQKSGVKKVVSYHKTLTYFFERFHLANPAVLEPKPGIPPTSGHILEVIQTIKTENIPLILIENYFDATVANRIREDVPKVRIVSVPVAVDGAPGVKTTDDLYETIVRAIEGK